MVFQCINIRQVPWEELETAAEYIRKVPWEVLKTAAFGLGFQHLPKDLGNVSAWKTMFDPNNDNTDTTYETTDTQTKTEEQQQRNRLGMVGRKTTWGFN